MTNTLFSTLLQPGQMPEMEGPSPVMAIIPAIFGLAFGVLMIAALWKVYSKANEPGWAAIIPIYNLIVLLKIAGRPVWWFILLLIPLVNIIISIIVHIDLARKFGKGAGFGIALVLFPIICFPILGFGGAQYNASA